MNILEVSNVSRKEESNFVVKNISFIQALFQKIAFAGATGSGKTTLLKMIAGLIECTEGVILFEGEGVLGPNEKLIAGHPLIAYLSQHFELRNHYRIEEILVMANKGTEAELQVIIDVCRIRHLQKRWTHQVSGGEKQRIALARLLATKPRLLLLDEPYSNLDPLHKQLLKQVVEDISQQLKLTCILVSHDPLDTLSWADEIIILKDGQIVQKGTPATIYYHPFDEYVAGLYGKYNLLPEHFFRKENSQAPNIGSSQLIRPEMIKIVERSEGIEGYVHRLRFMGSFYEVEVQVGELSVTVHTPRQGLIEGETIYLTR